MGGIRTAFRDGAFFDSLLLFLAIIALKAHVILVPRFFHRISEFGIYCLFAFRQKHGHIYFFSVQIRT